MEPTIDDLVARIADGEPVDWSEVERQAVDPVARELIAQLRAIEQLHDSHRSWADPAPEAAAEGQPDSGTPASADTTESPARLWGKYRLLAKLGAGSFGTVFRARDDDLHRDLAIKLLHPRGEGLDRLRQRLLREAQDLARVRHTNVVTIYAVEEHDGQVGLCMELIEGRTLDAVVRQDGPLNAEEATAVGQAVGRGLAAIHQAGLLHRDVKAKNVMRERAGRYVLMDLGAGVDTTDAARMAAAGMAGTPLYMAPEVLAGRGATVRGDIYGLGVLLYFLVSGRHPVEGRSRDDIVKAHSEGKRTFLTERRADLPEPFVRCVERALAREPLNRHGSAAELLAELPSAADAPKATTRSSMDLAAVGLAAVASGVAALAAVASALVLGGALSSAAVNHALGRPGRFAPEAAGDWLQWGRMAAVPFAVYFSMALLALQVVRGLVWVIVAALRRLMQLSAPGPQARKLGMWILGALSLAGVLAILYAFWDLVIAFTTPLDSVQSGDLVILAPEQRARKLLFGRSLAVAAAALATAWYLSIRAARREHVSVPVGAVALGAGAVAVTLLIWASAYQVFWHTDGFLRARFDDHQCFVIGETSEQVLLHCLDAPVGAKTLTVAKNAPRLQLLETRGSPYSKP